MTLPLEGIRIADLSWVVAGPFTTMFLATMGAEVIRIESSVHTDLNRRLPPYADGVFENSVERSGLWHGLNLSKKSCSVNLTKPRGQEIALELIKRCDVVVENFAYGRMERFNLGWERLHRAKPDLVMLTSSGLGRTGPHRTYVTFGPPMTAMTGLASITGQRGGRPERGIGGVYADHLSGLTACAHLLAALEYRARTGQGQLLEYSMAEMVMQQIPEAFIDYTANGRVWGPQGTRDTVYAPHGFFPATGTDRWVAIAVESDAAWHGLCRLMGRADWARDASLAAADGRRARQDELEPAIAVWTRPQEPEALAARLQAAGVAAASAQNSARLLQDPQLRHRGFFVTEQHPEVGSRELSSWGWILDGVEPMVEHAPTLGQDNFEVFTELLGMPVDEFAALVDEGVLI